MESDVGFAARMTVSIIEKLGIVDRDNPDAEILVLELANRPQTGCSIAWPVTQTSFTKVGLSK